MSSVSGAKRRQFLAVSAAALTAAAVHAEQVKRVKNGGETDIETNRQAAPVERWVYSSGSLTTSQRSSPACLSYAGP